MTNCKRAQICIAEAFGAELAAKERTKLDAHLGSCRRCRQEYLAGTALLAELRELEVPELSEANWAGYVPELRQRIAAQTQQSGWLDLFRQPVMAFLGVAMVIMTLSLVGQPTLPALPLQYGSETELEALLELTRSLDAATVEFYEPVEYAWDTSFDISEYADEDVDDSLDDDGDPFSFFDLDGEVDADQLEALRVTLGS